MGDWDWSERRAPILVAGGLRARSRRGAIGESWWSQRFLDALQGVYLGGRLARGRTYARRGQVISIETGPGTTTARVQGSRPRPYRVTIRVRVLDERAWAKVEASMGAKALFLAQLLSGEMPSTIEEAFRAAGVSLLPSRRGDLVTSCSCPDTGNPCKHIAAVFYLLAESFDGDPFLMFAWRGRTREQLLADLRRRRDPATRPRGRARRGPALAIGQPEPPMSAFWSGGPAWAEVRIEQHPTTAPDALLRELPSGLRRAMGADAVEGLGVVYREVAAFARRLLDPDVRAGR